jgi:hypothetical protein
MIYMAAADTTTIRVSTRTRDLLKTLAARRGEPAGDLIARLVSAADEKAMLEDAEASFKRIAGDPKAMAAYRAESDELEAFDASAPEW